MEVMLHTEHTAGALTDTGPNEQVPVVASVTVTLAAPPLIGKLPNCALAEPYVNGPNACAAPPLCTTLTLYWVPMPLPTGFNVNRK